MGYSEDEFKRMEEGFVPEVMKPGHPSFETLTDEEIEEGLTALHGTTELDMESIEAELQAASSEYQHYRRRQQEAGIKQGRKLEELQVLLAGESRKVADGLRQVEVSIAFFEQQIEKDEARIEGLLDNRAGNYERSLWRAYTVAHRAAISALRAVKRELERRDIA